MASNQNNPTMVTPAGEPETDFSVTPAEARALGALGTERAAL